MLCVSTTTIDPAHISPSAERSARIREARLCALGNTYEAAVAPILINSSPGRAPIRAFDPGAIMEAPYMPVDVHDPPTDLDRWDDDGSPPVMGRSAIVARLVDAAPSTTPG